MRTLGVGRLGFAVSRGLLQGIVDSTFANSFQGGACRGQLTFLESLPEEFFEGLPVRNKPALHALHHEMTISILAARRFVPAISLTMFQMLPRLP